MKNFLIALLIISSMAQAEIRFRPSLITGKMTNGNFYRELVPFRASWTPAPEWIISGGYSLGFEGDRSKGFFQTYNHRGWMFQGKVTFKPLAFAKQYINSSLTDFAISYKKQIGGYYDGYSLDVGRLDYNDYEEIGIGFEIKW